MIDDDSYPEPDDEIHALKKRIATLEQEIEQERKAGEQRNTACGDALEKLWQEIIIAKSPDYGEWEYPGQAYRHLKAEYDDQQKRIAELKNRNVELLEQVKRLQLIVQKKGA